MKIILNGKAYEARQNEDGRIEYKDETGWYPVPRWAIVTCLDLEGETIDLNRGDKGIQL